MNQQGLANACRHQENERQQARFAPVQASLADAAAQGNPVQVLYGSTAALVVAIAALGSGAGCAAMTNPLAGGVPVRHVPPELLASSRAGEQTIPLHLLRQPPPKAYRLDAGDVLGVYVEGFLGDRNIPLPVHVGQLVQPRDQRRWSASTGYPVPVQEDGTIDLPVAGPLPVRGLTVAEARDAIRDHYLPTGTHILPRDRDLDVLEAVAAVHGPLFNGAFGTNNLSGSLIQPGIGNPSPALLTVLRRTPNGGQVPIVVDLRAAVCDPRERILVKPGDLLVLQEFPEQALTRYFTQTLFNFNLYWQAISSKNAVGVIDVATPDRLPTRSAITNFNQ